MKNLLGRINYTLEREAERKRVYFPSDEYVTVEIELSNEEKEKFYDIELNENYNWEMKDNLLTITYSESDM